MSTASCSMAFCAFNVECVPAFSTQSQLTTPSQCCLTSFCTAMSYTAPSSPFLHRSIIYQLIFFTIRFSKSTFNKKKFWNKWKSCPVYSDINQVVFKGFNATDPVYSSSQSQPNKDIYYNQWKELTLFSPLFIWWSKLKESYLERSNFPSSFEIRVQCTIIK